jgi:hypothetical protein
MASSSGSYVLCSSQYRASLNNVRTSAQERRFIERALVEGLLFLVEREHGFPKGGVEEAQNELRKIYGLKGR